MTISHFFYQLLIGPLELIFEAAYGAASLFFRNPGRAIVVLSLTINVLLLPLYRRADAIQAEERNAEKRLEGWVAHIKKTFKGDERFMMLQTFYRQNGYRPYYSLRGSLPLVLEIPFFIAAYHFLSHLQELHGRSFGPIADLGAPDALLTVAGVTIHLLPILMTAVNFVSSAVYTRGHPLREKIQLYGMALIFLALLYNSPSGLVFYWTLNNLFSLAKNLFARLRNPRRVLFVSLTAGGLLLLVYGVFFYRTWSEERRMIVIALALTMEVLTLAVYFLRRSRGKTAQVRRPGDARLFFGGCLFLAVLTGLLIPSAVIGSSPAEFVHMENLYSPLRHVLNASLLSAGLFVVWFGVFYFIASDRIRWVFDLLVWVVAGAAAADYMFFGTKLGTLSPELRYDLTPAFSLGEKAGNLAVLLVLAAVLALVYFKNRKAARVSLVVLSAAVLCMSAVNVAGIRRAMPEIEQSTGSGRRGRMEISLSTEGKNVVVVMLDRAISGYLPYLFRERPELKEQFAGFTYYPNTVSLAGYTNLATPALYGGYEYTPERINARPDEPLADKQNEALRMLPVLFDQRGYEVTVADPPYANYSWIPDLSIFDEYPGIRAYLSEQGQFVSSLWSEEERLRQQDRIWERNFFCFSLMKIAPVAVQNLLYLNGGYYNPDSNEMTMQVAQGLSKAVGVQKKFIQSFSVLQALPEVTNISREDKNTFFFLCNSTTHEPMLLQEPEYLPATAVDNTAYDEAHRDRFALNGRTLRVKTLEHMQTYQTNMAAMIQIGRWLDCLRQNGVYDNTRIILVADHGKDLGQFKDMVFGPEEYQDVMNFNPLLLVKDFDSAAFTVDRAFMTNADVPTLAVAGVIDDPVNPFTGKPVSSEAKLAAPMKILGSDNWSITDNGGNVFEPGVWLSVHDDIFDPDNWEILGVY